MSRRYARVKLARIGAFGGVIGVLILITLVYSQDKTARSTIHERDREKEESKIGLVRPELSRILDKDVDDIDLESQGGPSGARQETNERVGPATGQEGRIQVILTELDSKVPWELVLNRLGIDSNREAEVVVGEGITPFVTVSSKADYRISYRFFDHEYVSYVGKTSVVPRQLTHADAISPEDGRRAAQELFDLLGIDINFADISFYMDDYSNAYGPKDLTGAHWRFEKHLLYQDFETEARVSVAVCAYTGKVISFSRTPLLIPTEMQLSLSEAEAVSFASTFAESIGLSIADTRVIAKHIISPHKYIWVDNYNGPGGREFERPRPAYLVVAEKIARNSGDPITHSNDPVEAQPRKPPHYSFFVDGITGEVIGGSGKNPMSFPSY